MSFKNPHYKPKYMTNNINNLKQLLCSKKGLLGVIASIALFNIFVFSLSNYKSIPSFQSRGHTSGFSYSKAKHFAYFHYYTGDFPLATLNKNLEYTKEAAQKEINENGESLIMEYQHWSRLGEHARIWAFLPNAIVKGSPENPSIKLFNSIFFTFSLIILYFGFWRLKMVLYGISLIVLISLTPFFLFETYSNQNIFGLLGATFFIVLGLNAYALFKKEKLLISLILVTISGAVIGFSSEFRNEISVVLLSLVFIILLMKQKHLITKLLVISLGLVSFFTTKNIIRNHFDKKFQNTIELVENSGGYPYKWATTSGHRTWHPIYCGLGDFDNKYDFVWDDRVPYHYAVPILIEKYGLDIEYSGKYYFDNYYDEKELYYVKIEDLDEYEQIVKEKVLYHIKNDPIWYLTIIVKRILQTLSVTIPIPYIGWWVFFVAYYFIKNKLWPYLSLVIVGLPLSATSIIVYSGDNSTYNSIFVYFVIVSLIMIYYKSIQTTNSKSKQIS